MTNAKDLLTDYEEFSKTESVSLGDGRTVDDIGAGKVDLSMQFKKCASALCPKLACNLFSVRVAASKGNLEGRSAGSETRGDVCLVWVLS